MKNNSGSFGTTQHQQVHGVNHARGNSVMLPNGQVSRMANRNSNVVNVGQMQTVSGVNGESKLGFSGQDTSNARHNHH